MHILDLIVICLYALGLLGIAYFSRRAKSMDDFAVGSRQIPGGIILATL